MKLKLMILSWKAWPVFALALSALLPCCGLAQTAPIISQQPQNQSAAAGSSANFTVAVSGQAPLMYQWLFNGTNLTDNFHIRGATNLALTIAALQSGDNGGYSVIVSNGYGMVTSAVATLKVGITLPGLISAAVAWADYDNDGLMDVLMAGTTAAGARFTRLYHNIGSALFEEVNVLLPQVTLASFAWGDYDNDGKLDFVITGENGPTAFTEVYHNDGNGIFTDINASLSPQANADVIWVDYDNDGRLDLDLALYGQFFHNQGNGTFVPAPFNTAGAYPGRLDRGDFDNDGDQDFTLIAPLQFNGVPPSIVRNDGPANFPRALFGWETYSYSYNFVDYDNDGDLDVLFSDYFAQKPIRIYQNDGHGNLTLMDVNMRAFSALASTWGDYNNDGKLDCLTMEHGTEGDLVEVLFDEGTNWNHSLWFSSIWQGSVSFVDIDNDGDLDVYYTGKFASFISLTQSGFLTNNIAAANTPPTAPAGLTHDIVKGNTVYLHWTPSTDAQTPSPGLNYNLRVGTTPGGLEIMSPASDLATGRRQLLARGNAGSTNFWVLRELPVGTYYWSAQAIDPTFAGSPFTLIEDSFSITSAPPRIVSQPVSQSIVLGSNVVFSITNTGTGPLTYQWQKGGTNIFDGGNIAGSTTGALVISGVLSNDAGGYRVILTNSLDVVTSSVATLTVLFPPTLTTQPNNQTAILGANLSLVSLATGTTPLSYRWQKNGTNLLNGGTVSGVTTATLQFTGALSGDSGNYTVMVTNVAGSVTSAVAVVSIVPLTITSQPVSRTLLAGTNVSFTVGASGIAPISYQWRFNFSDLPGKTNATLTLTNVQAASGGDYYVLVANPNTNLTSAVATLTVLPATPTFTTQAVSRVASVGQNVSFTVAAKGSEPMTCQWLFNGTNLPGANSFTLALTNVNASFAGTYRAAVTNAAGFALSTNATLVVSPVVIWGLTNNGQLLVSAALPAGATNVIAIAAGAVTDGGLPCMALRADGSIVTWGYFSRDPVPPTNAVDLVAISVGASGSTVNNLVLRMDGTVVNWTSSTKPPTALVSNSNLVAVAAGGAHQLAQRDDGTVIAWGSNTSGQTNVPPSATNVIAIAAGTSHSLALRADGTVVGWGLNTSGQTTALSNVVNVVAIAAGGNQSLALLADGSVVGRIVTNGPTANGTPNYGSPVGNLTGKIAIAAGTYHSLALGTNRFIGGWGATNYGQLNIPASATNAVAIAAGGGNSLALVSDPFAPPLPPRIGRPPLGRALKTGQNVVFNALAVGGLPLHYQWLINGSPLAGKTNQWFPLASAHPRDAGDYQLVALNDFGAVTSAVATVTVEIPSPNLISLGMATNGFRFSFASVAGLIYIVEFKTGLSLGAWSELERRLGTGGMEMVTDTSAAGAMRFYRVRTVYAPSPKLVAGSGSVGAMAFSFGSVAGAQYIVEGTDQLVPPQWHEHQMISGTGASINFTNQASAGPQQFYRLSVR